MIDSELREELEHARENAMQLGGSLCRLYRKLQAGWGEDNDRDILMSEIDRHRIAANDISDRLYERLERLGK